MNEVNGSFHLLWKEPFTFWTASISKNKGRLRDSKPLFLFDVNPD
jgi:hypothetical protein